MHYVIGLITAIAGLLFALNRLQNAGLDLNAFNPFLWYRRAQWRKKYGNKPLYSLDKPMDVAGLLLLATAKCEGEVSSTQKQQLKAIYEQEFHLSQDEANGLLVGSSFLLKDEVSVVDQLGKITERSRPRFTPEQVDSILDLMGRVARIDGPPNADQERLMDRTRQVLDVAGATTRKWE